MVFCHYTLSLHSQESRVCPVSSIMFLKKKRYFNWLVVSRHQAMCRPKETSIETRLHFAYRRTLYRWFRSLILGWGNRHAGWANAWWQGWTSKWDRGSGTPRPRFGQGKLRFSQALRAAIWTFWGRSMRACFPSAMKRKLEGKAEVPSQCLATSLIMLDRRHCSLAHPENCDSQFHQCSRYWYHKFLA